MFQAVSFTDEKTEPNRKLFVLDLIAVHGQIQGYTQGPLTPNFMYFVFQEGVSIESRDSNRCLYTSVHSSIKYIVKR